MRCDGGSRLMDADGAEVKSADEADDADRLIAMHGVSEGSHSARAAPKEGTAIEGSGGELTRDGAGGQGETAEEQAEHGQSQAEHGWQAWGRQL